MKGEGLIPGKLCLACRDQSVALPDVMDIVYSETSALRKKGQMISPEKEKPE